MYFEHFYRDDYLANIILYVCVLIARQFYFIKKKMNKTRYISSLSFKKLLKKNK